MLTVCLSDVLSLNTLQMAWSKVLANQGSGGVDGVSLADYERDLDNNLNYLRHEVEQKTYQPLPLLRVEINASSEKGTRLLSIPTIRDRVLQTAVAVVLTPIFEEEFEEISFAYRQGRSIQQAVSLIERLRDEGYHWVVDADIEHFFDSVDHDQLMAKVEQLVFDIDILRLIRQWLKSVIVDGEKRFRLTRGIAQGSPLSPLLANLFLDHLDESLLDKNIRIVRYSDDFLVLCKTQKKAEAALELTEDVLHALHLNLNKTKTKIVDFNQGFRFLGVQFIRSLCFKSHKKGIINSTKQITHTLASDKYQQSIHQWVDYGHNKRPPSPNRNSYTLPDGYSFQYPNNEMQNAFAQQAIIAEQFPSEPLPEQQLSPPAIKNETMAKDNFFADEKEITTHNSPKLKTLYLTKHGSVLGKEYERFVIKYKGKIIKTIPAIHVDQIMVYGNAQLTTQVMQFCLQQRIPIYLLSSKGRFYGVVDSFDTEPVLLHKAQFLRADDPLFCFSLAQAIIKGKIANSRLILKRQARHKQAPAFVRASEQLGTLLRQLPNATSLEQLRGYEGSAARIYFQSLAATLAVQWGFTRRVKNPPTDPINALLSYGYTLLFHNIYSLLRVRGLNPHVGYLHPMRMGHPALASDMMEEFRAIVVDTVVFNLVFNEKITLNDFIFSEDNDSPCLLTPEARKVFIKHIEAKMNAHIRHPKTHLKLDYRRCMAHQINHLARVIRQQDSCYQAMVLR